jgi:hypothetical protein
LHLISFFWGGQQMLLLENKGNYKTLVAAGSSLSLERPKKNKKKTVNPRGF